MLTRKASPVQQSALARAALLLQEWEESGSAALDAVHAEELELLAAILTARAQMMAPISDALLALEGARSDELASAAERAQAMDAQLQAALSTRRDRLSGEIAQLDRASAGTAGYRGGNGSPRSRIDLRR